ncbi:MAG: putative Fe-S protein YdhL (DUF1289 family) [Enterobacterales bacterium]|jgi:predicted Fe-S protein YdhL (DUF1289 family)
MSIIPKSTSSSTVTASTDSIDVEAPIKSPCISICALDSQGLCTGCFRTGEEIRDWGNSTNQQRRNVLGLIHQREKQVNPFL